MNHKAHVQLETHTVEDTQQFGQLLGRWVKTKRRTFMYCLNLVIWGQEKHIYPKALRKALALQRRLQALPLLS